MLSLRRRFGLYRLSRKCCKSHSPTANDSIGGLLSENSSHAAREPESDPYQQGYRTEQWASRLFPNGEGSIGYIPHKKREKSAKEKRFDRDARNQSHYFKVLDSAKETETQAALDRRDTQELLERLNAVSHDDVVFNRLQADREGIEQEVTYQDGTGWEQTVKVFDPHRQKVKRPPKGRKGITRKGCKAVRNACHVLQKHFGRKRLGFGTLTLDSGTQYYLLLCCIQWAEIVRKFNQELQRELERVGAPSHVVGVTEIQTKRSDDIGYIVPHLHFVYVSWDGKSKVKQGFGEDAKLIPDFYISHARMKEIFDRVCVNEIARITETPVEEISVNNRVNLQGVRKSAEGYLGKYMSKGAKDVEKYIEADPNRNDIPSHWWHCSKELRSIVKGLTQAVPAPIVESILWNYEYLIEEEIVLYCKEITKEINGKIRIIGYAFRLHPSYNPIGKKEIDRAFNSTEQSKTQNL